MVADFFTDFLISDLKHALYTLQEILVHHSKMIMPEGAPGYVISWENEDCDNL